MAFGHGDSLTKIRLDNLLNLIREHEADASVLLFFAAGTIGVIFQAGIPLDTGGEVVKLANNIAGHRGFANPFDSLATGLTASNPPMYPLLLAGFVRLHDHRLGSRLSRQIP